MDSRSLLEPPRTLRRLLPLEGWCDPQSLRRFNLTPMPQDKRKLDQSRASGIGLSGTDGPTVLSFIEQCGSSGLQGPLCSEATLPGLGLRETAGSGLPPAPTPAPDPQRPAPVSNARAPRPSPRALQCGSPVPMDESGVPSYEGYVGRSRVGNDGGNPGVAVDGCFLAGAGRVRRACTGLRPAEPEACKWRPQPIRPGSALTPGFSETLQHDQKLDGLPIVEYRQQGLIGPGTASLGVSQQHAPLVGESEESLSAVGRIECHGHELAVLQAPDHQRCRGTVQGHEPSDSVLPDVGMLAQCEQDRVLGRRDIEIGAGLRESGRRHLMSPADEKLGAAVQNFQGRVARLRCDCGGFRPRACSRYPLALRPQLIGRAHCVQSRWAILQFSVHRLILLRPVPAALGQNQA